MAINNHALTAGEYAAGLRALADALEKAGTPANLRFTKQPIGMTMYVASPDDVRDFALKHDLQVSVSDPGDGQSIHTGTDLALDPNPNTYYAGSAVLSVLHITQAEDPEEAPVEEPAPEPVTPGRRPVASGDTFREAPASELRDGDGILNRYHDAAGMYVEEVVTVQSVTTRRYGKGSRVILDTLGALRDSYKPTHVFGVLDTPEPIYLELDGVVMKTTADDDNLSDLEESGWRRISRDEAMSWQPLEDTVGVGGSTVVPTADLDAPVPYVQVERVDPDDPTSMVLPVIGDTVSLHDGTIARVDSRLRYQKGAGWDERWTVAPLDRSALREVTLDEIAGYPDDEAVRFAKVLAEVAAVSEANHREDAPALVQLDQADAADRLADAVTDLLVLIGPMTFGPDDNVAPVRQALADFRAVAS